MSFHNLSYVAFLPLAAVCYLKAPKKVQPGVLLETVCDEHLLIATGEARGKVPYVKNLNETGVWFWQLFEKQLDLAQIEQQAIQTFHISAEQAHNALTAFFGKLQNDGYLIVPKE